MRFIIIASLLLFFVICSAAAALAQTDELRAATGLPIQIGQPAIFGQVTLKGLAKSERKPVIFVTLVESGSQLGRIQTNESGYYYFLTLPRGSGTLIFEINSSEVGRMVVNVPPGSSRNLRQDISIDWQEFAQRTQTGVVTAVENYPRDADNLKAFETALQFASNKEYDRARTAFSSILAKDPKDYVAWAEMGTIYFKQDSLDNAEACYFKSIELKRDYFVALLNLGKLYLTQKKFDNAILVLSNAVASRPTSADAQQQLGEAYLQNKKGSLAVTHFNEALRLAPDEKAEIHLRLAALYDAAGAKGMASAEYKKFLQKRPDHAEKKKLEEYIKANPPK